jgi:hypothetical protein
MIVAPLSYQAIGFWGLLNFFLANFGLFLAIMEFFGFHVAYIGGTYRVQKSDLDDSAEGKKNM